ncbi:S-formylglutathione hydrolase [Roseitalea porphyridii]|uniref:S-formylglutathione hydrolase n=1 Tax=Roseitalea porphyridii TaxID=1852022 RepID=A0A4P6V487_9HYPH|nr:S-formylglutathione hydrolase [Roseitalea porphyridii]QBK32271.1 S-formylglutathione hydrolase [Roseitalea porphyridii]
MNPVLSHKCFGGLLTVHDHDSAVTNCTMRFAVYSPPQAETEAVPVLWYLSGLTCTWQNVNEKAGIQRYAAEHGIMVVFPDTSPRGDDVADDAAYDLGQGAGFYLTATEEPWARHFRMDRYVVDELPGLIADMFPKADMDRQGITGHSMGGHGALTLHLKHPERYRSVSAFAPIVAPTQVPWGEKAFSTYLGPDRTVWNDYDATKLVARRRTDAHILIDQGGSDQFLAEQLRPELFAEACRHAGQKLTLNMREGYDHSYYFVGTFLAEHFAHHGVTLKG